MFGSLSSFHAHPSSEAGPSHKPPGCLPHTGKAITLVAAQPLPQNSAVIVRLIEEKAELECQLQEALLQLGLLQDILHTRSH